MEDVTALLVCGSLQARSANRRALEVVADRLTATGAAVAWFERLADVPAMDPDREPDAAVLALRDASAAADVVAIAAPEYAGGVAGATKNALDWMVGLGGLYRTPVVLVSAGTSGGANARADLVRTLTWQGAHVVGQLGIVAPRTLTDDQGRYTDPATVRALHDLADLARRAPSLPAQERLALVRSATDAIGVDPGQIAPVA